MAQTTRTSGEDDARIISDPLYLPLSGQVYGSTIYTLSEPQGDNVKGSTRTGSFTSSNSLLNQSIAYGITRDLAVRVAMGYGWNQRDSTSAVTGAVTNGNSQGFSDPAISATYRVLDERHSPFVLDLTGSYSPDAIHATTSGGDNNGNIARGGQTMGFSVTVGRITRSFTIALSAGGTAVGRETSELLSNGTSTQSDSHWNYGVGVETQSRFSRRVSVNLGASFASTGSYGVANVVSGNPRTSEGPDTRSVDVALNYHLVPNRLVAAATYTFNSYSDSQNIFPNPVSNTSVTGRFGNVVGVRLLYAFN
jgi:hypothetical protein